MMKRYLAMILAAVVLLGLLAGCASQKQEDPKAPTIREEQPTEPLEPGTYEPDSAIEQESLGAVRSFLPPVADAVHVLAARENVILFSGTEKTTLTVLAGENLAQRLQRTLDVLLTPEEVSVNLEKGELAYYDAARKAVVVLDANLREARQIPLPEAAIGKGILAPDWKTVYYAAADGLYGLDLGTGLPRLIKQQKNDASTMLQLCFDGEVLACTCHLDNGQVETHFLHTEDGRTLYTTRPLPRFASNRDVYFFPRTEGSVLRYGCGLWAEEPRQLTIPLEASAMPVMNLSGALILRQDDRQLTLEFADLLRLEKTAALTLEGQREILAADGFGSHMLLLVREGEAVRLWKWDLEKSRSPQAESCTVPYETWSQLDSEALRASKDKATALGNRFGVRVLVATEVLTMVPEGCTVEPEYLSQAYQRDMKALERGLAAFPQDFFRKASEGAGELTISMARSVTRNDQPLDDRENGMLYWDEDAVGLILTMGEDLEQNFYHAMSHLIDTQVIGNSLAYDDWEKHNPASFSYDYNYLTNLEREDDGYLEGEDRAFIDTFSMSFPREDRARILEYAMMPGNEAYFQSEIMQEKLLSICIGIREGFELPESGHYVWEQYLRPVEED